MGILRDIKTAASIFGEVRKARKRGAETVQLRPIKVLPVIELAPAFLNTMEGCRVWNYDRAVYQTVEGVFDDLPYEVQRRLEFSPEKPGEWVERARFWKKELRPILPEKTYHKVMELLINWSARCLRRQNRKGLRNEIPYQHQAVHSCYAGALRRERPGSGDLPGLLPPGPERRLPLGLQALERCPLSGIAEGGKAAAN